MPATLALLPGAVVLAPHGDDAYAVRGEVLGTRFAGDRMVVTVALDHLGPVEVSAPLDPALEAGSTIAIRIDPARVAPLRAPSSGA